MKPQPGIMDIAPYVSGKPAAAGMSNAVKLSANENPFGPSPKAQEAFLAEATRLNVYPSTDHADLIDAISKKYEVDPKRITCGCGSDELLNLFCYAFSGPGDEVIFTEHGFSVYRIAALAAGATPVEVGERDRTTDIDAILKRVTPKTRLIFIANPNNPTGTMVPLGELERLAIGLPKECLLVIDSAYAEFVEGYDGGISLVERYENVAMTRTFSKLYGLGGLRIGWAYSASQIWDVLNRIRPPFNLSNAGISAAKAALTDEGFIQLCLEENAKWRRYLIDELRALGLPCDDSHANFVLPKFADANTADAAFQALSKAGIITRQVGGYNLPDYLRITVGKGDDCKRIITVLREFLGQSS